MKKIMFGILGILAIATIAQFAVSDPAPFNFETIRRFKKVEVKQVMRFQMNSAVFPASDTLTLTDQFGNPAVLPAGADVLHTYYYVKTALLPSGAQFKVACGGANLFSAADETGVLAGGVFDGNPAYNYAYNGSTAYVGASQCTITATQTVAYFTSGKVYGYVEYVNVLP